jgi:hypothetical protein
MPPSYESSGDFSDDSNMNKMSFDREVEGLVTDERKKERQEKREREHGDQRKRTGQDRKQTYTVYLTHRKSAEKCGRELSNAVSPVGSLGIPRALHPKSLTVRTPPTNLCLIVLTCISLFSNVACLCSLLSRSSLDAVFTSHRHYH